MVKVTSCSQPTNTRVSVAAVVISALDLGKVSGLVDDDIGAVGSVAGAGRGRVRVPARAVVHVALAWNRVGHDGALACAGRVGAADLCVAAGGAVALGRHVVEHLRDGAAHARGRALEVLLCVLLVIRLRAWSDAIWNIPKCKAWMNLPSLAADPELAAVAAPCAYWTQPESAEVSVLLCEVLQSEAITVRFRGEFSCTLEACAPSTVALMVADSMLASPMISVLLAAAYLTEPVVAMSKSPPALRSCTSATSHWASMVSPAPRVWNSSASTRLESTMIFNPLNATLSPVDWVSSDVGKGTSKLSLTSHGYGSLLNRA